MKISSSSASSPWSPPSFTPLSSPSLSPFPFPPPRPPRPLLLFLLVYLLLLLLLFFEKPNASLSSVSSSSDRGWCRRPHVRRPPHPPPHLPHEEEGRGQLRFGEEAHLQESPHHRDLRIDPDLHLPHHKHKHTPHLKNPISASSSYLLLLLLLLTFLQRSDARLKKKK